MFVWLVDNEDGSVKPSDTISVALSAGKEAAYRGIRSRCPLGLAAVEAPSIFSSADDMLVSANTRARYHQSRSTYLLKNGLGRNVDFVLCLWQTLIRVPGLRQPADTHDMRLRCRLFSPPDKRGYFSRFEDYVGTAFRWFA